MSDNHQKLMDEAYETWKQNEHWSFQTFLGTLRPLHYFAVMTGNLNYQVCNGGFSQYLCNNYATRSGLSYLIKHLAATEKPACVAVSKIVREFRNILHNVEPNAEQFEDDEDFDYDHMSELDDEFYKVNEQFMVECEELINLELSKVNLQNTSR